MTFTANIILNGERLKVFRIGNKQRCLVSHKGNSSNDVFIRERKNNPGIHMNHKKIPSGSRNLGTEEQSGVITLPDFKLYYKA